MAPDRKEKPIAAWLCGVLAVLTLIVYWPTYFADFVNFDDHQYVVENERVLSGLTWGNVRWAMTQVGYASNWHPLTWLSHMLDVELFGPGAGPHHVVNVVIHAANAVLLFLLLRSLTGAMIPSFVVAMLFAIHPMNVESVAWISQRKTTLSTFFCILAIWSYARYARLNSWKAYVGSLLLFLMSLMAKPMMVTMPFALLLLDFWPLERAALKPNTLNTDTFRIGTLAKGLVRLIPEKLPFAGLTLLVSWVTLWAQEGAMSPMNQYALHERLANVAVSYVEYLRLMVWPFKLAVFYPLFGTDLDNTPIKVGLSVLFILLISLICLRFGWTRRYLLTGWLWYLGTMIPVIGLVHVGAQALADRYVYVPFWGIWIAVVWLIWEFTVQLANKSRFQIGLVGFSIAVALVFCGLTMRQASKWNDTVTLFQDAAANTKRNWLAHRILAEHYLEIRDYDQALIHCKMSDQWAVEDPRFLTTYGRVLHEMGTEAEGLKKLHRAMELRPDLAIVRVNLGWVHLSSGRYDEAAAQFEAAASMLTDTDTPYAWRMTYANWGAALAKAGRNAEGLAKVDYALSFEPDHTDLLRLAAEIELAMNQPEAARIRLQKVITKDPEDVQAYEILTRSFLLEENLTDAIASLVRTIQLVPHHYDARMQLAELLDKQGQSQAASDLYLGLINELTSIDHPKVKSFLVKAYSKLAELNKNSGDLSGAIKNYDKAIGLDRNDLAANRQLAWILATSFDEKLREPVRSLELAQHAANLSAPPEATTLSVLSAALAINEQFDKAVESVEQAAAIAQGADDQLLTERMAKQLESYRLGQLYVESRPTTAETNVQAP